MTVKELMEQLSKQDPDATVVQFDGFDSGEDSGYHYDIFTVKVVEHRPFGDCFPIESIVELN